jgi:hypothetical protein
MVPFAHLLWGAVWAGIAAAAAGKAQAFIRMRCAVQRPDAAGRRAFHPGGLDAAHAARRAVARTAQLRSGMSDEKAISSLEFQSMITLTKVQASELAVATVLSALRACGLSGYRNDTEFSIGRHLRDVLSAPLMINNDRILANLATTSLMTPLPASISGEPNMSNAATRRRRQVAAIRLPPSPTRCSPMGVDGVYARTALYVRRCSSASKPTSRGSATRARDHALSRP